MKDYKEVSKTVFERRAEMENRRNENRKKIARTLVPLCCVCFVALLGLGVWQGGIFEKQPTQTPTDITFPVIENNSRVNKEEISGVSKANNKIVINHIDGISARKMGICLFVEDFVKMTEEEICEYYGINIFPAVPGDMKEWDEQRFGIYRREKGTGEVYYDQTVLNYSNEDFTRGINIELKKGSLPILDYGFGEGSEEKSVINNHELFIGLSESGYYYAVFMYENVGFCVNSEGMTQDEFVSVLSSIVQA